ncbi:hypothetical protein SAMN02746041_01625 [Desulfacinum hydrothermale DSM 13146]|uniref:Phospholipid-binding protein, PBP family n=1 Tax=Desulfacinum hydrothermale DSM 13146 TaxID=1121390 RepID=A0A1W1XHN5_9BACT|nr:YbhB/YbcL family Raf kinase inhibitor-like protein [Desulfacinum hydrothermale]SMC23021.1 hypothetical protein SAMN02746041_01625 [Desulfacinum hydrothermale DSM 13146]
MKVKMMAMMVLAWMMSWALPVAAGDLELRSPAFADGGRIPLRYVMPAAGGNNLSLALTWTGVPDRARSLALSVVDPHPVANNWLHWLVVDIPPEVGGLKEGASGRSMPRGCRELLNSFGFRGYGGPQPPRGTGDHPYVVTLYALDRDRLAIGDQAGLEGFLRAVRGHVLEKATLTGYFGR